MPNYRTVMLKLLNLKMKFETMVKVDEDLCIGCGACVALCSEVFEIGKDGKSKVKKQKNLECVDQAIESCPVGAISK